MSTHPQCSTANCNPAAPLLAAKCTRRSPAEVARSKAEIEAKQRALQQQTEDNLRQLEELQRDLDAQEKENAALAARPPPKQPVTKKPTSAPLTPHPVQVSRPHSDSKADRRAATDDDKPEGTPVGQRIQPGRAKRLRRQDLEAYGERDLTVAGAPDGLGVGDTTTSQTAAATTTEVSKAQAASKKRKSEGANEDK